MNKHTPAAIDTFDYIGRKKTLFKWIINRIPPHLNYYELFCGSAYIALNKKPATGINLINDISRYPIDKINYKGSRNIKISMPAVDLLKDGKVLDRPDSFVYLDPPYPLSSRKGKRKLYKYEMTDLDHSQLLTSIIDRKFNCMISTSPNELYSSMLDRWNSETIQMQTRGGAVTEQIFYNYDKPTVLHQYDYLGENFTERQRIKRKISRAIKRLISMEAAERNAVLAAIAENFYKVL